MTTPFDRVLNVTENFPLARATSMGVGGPTRYLLRPKTAGEIKNAIRIAGHEGIPLAVLGGGTNVIADDCGFPGAVLITTGLMSLRVSADLIRVGTGWSLARLIETAANAGFSGFEELAGIPGTVGGAVAMNAGALESVISDRLYMVEVVTADGDEREYNRPELEFAYRKSPFFERGEIVTSVTFKPRRDETAQIRKRTHAVLATRRDRQPLGRSAGCIFRNPAGAKTAGQLIDQAGLKGTRIGGAVVTHRHANWIVAEEGATGRDCIELIKTIQAKVLEKMGIELELEVRILSCTGLKTSTD